MLHPESVPGGSMEQLQTVIKCSPQFSHQTEESTYIAGFAQLLVFIKFCFEGNIKKFHVLRTAFRQMYRK